MILFDYIGNRACEEAEKNFKEFLKRDELQNILLQCFKDADIIIDSSVKKMILDIRSDDIKPNMSIEEINNNLDEIFQNVIDSSGEEPQDNKKLYICSEYLKRSRKTVLKLYHVLEILDDVKKDVSKLMQSDLMQQKTSKKVDKIYEELLKRRGNQIYFIDELNSSKIFWYCEIEICTFFEGLEETLEDIFNQIREDTTVYFEEDYNTTTFFCTIFISFTEPLIQYKFRDFLKHIDRLFASEGIMISNITTHS